MPQQACERYIFHVMAYAFLSESDRKNGAFQKAENEPKMKLFDFGAFQKQMHMPSREKYIFHVLFRTFHKL